MKFFRSVIKPASAFSRILYQLIFMVCIGLGSLGFIASEICTRGMMDEAKKNNYLVLRQNQGSIENDLQRIKTVLIQAGRAPSSRSSMISSLMFTTRTRSCAGA